MKASELVERVQALITQHGDHDVFLDVSEHGLKQIEEVDIDVDDTGFMIWAETEK